jgi:hypothetical protein
MNNFTIAVKPHHCELFAQTEKEPVSLIPLLKWVKLEYQPIVICYALHPRRYYLVSVAEDSYPSDSARRNTRLSSLIDRLETGWSFVEGVYVSPPTSSLMPGQVKELVKEVLNIQSN